MNYSKEQFEIEETVVLKKRKEKKKRYTVCAVLNQRRKIHLTKQLKLTKPYT